MVTILCTALVSLHTITKSLPLIPAKKSMASDRYAVGLRGRERTKPDLRGVSKREEILVVSEGSLRLSRGMHVFVTDS